MKRLKIIVLSLVASLFLTMLPTPVYANEDQNKANQVGQTYYVDSKNGSDTNDGESETTAFKSLEKMNTIELQEGDVVYLKKGSEFNEQLKLKGMGSEEHPISITSYGEGQTKPIINGGGVIYPDAANNTSAAVLIENMQHVVISDLEITNDDNFSTSVTGTRLRRLGIHITINEDAPTFIVGQRAWKDITVKDCYIHDVDGDEQRGPNKVNGGIGVEVFFRQANNVYPYFDGVLIESNVIEKVNRTGIKGIRLTELSLDDKDGGDDIRYRAVRETADKNQAGRNFVVRNNDLSNIGGDGILIDSTIKAVVERNVLYDHTKRSTVANAGIWCWNTIDTLFQYNESYGGPIYNQDGCSYDCDYFSAGTIFQYNYSHDTPMGFMLLMGGNEMDIVRYNISQNDGIAWRHFSADSTTKSYIYNNVFYYDGAKWKWAGNNDLRNNYEFYNNIFYNHNATTASSWGSTMDWSKGIFENNVVYEKSNKVGSNEISNAIHVDPKFVNPGSGETNNWSSLTGYQLLDDSPLIDTGSYVKLDFSGTKLLDSREYYTATTDFYGNPLYTGAPDIGVYESPNPTNETKTNIESNATYRILSSKNQKYLQKENTSVVLNDNRQEMQEFMLVNSGNGYKIKVLADNTYLHNTGSEVTFGQQATIWQVEDMKNGLVRIKNQDKILTFSDSGVTLSSTTGENQQWYLQFVDSSKAFNSGGNSVEGYSSDQEFKEEPLTPGRYGSVEVVSKGSTEIDVFSTAITGDRFGYKFPISKGNYNIKLSFAELEEIEDRTFDILVNGEVYAERYKINSNSKIEEIGNIAAKNGFIDIQLVATYNDKGVKTKALLNAVSLERCLNSDVNLILNCGGGAVDGLLTDAAYPSNGSGYYGVSNEISGARPFPDGGMPTAMQTGREGQEFGYKFNVESGNYRLKLLFNEFNANAKIGDRIFDIYVNNQLVVENFDIIREAGKNAVTIDFTKNIKSEGGIIDVKFVGKDGKKALVNAILVDVLTKSESRENLLLNKPATSSSTETQDGRFVPTYAVDGNQASRWSSGYTDSEWLMVDMEEAYLVDSVFIDWTYGAYATKYRIETSIDGVQWHVAARISDAKAGLNTISFSPVEARYVRMYGEKRNSSWGMSMTQMEAYGTKIKDAIKLEGDTQQKQDNEYTLTLKARNVYKRYTEMEVTVDYDPTVVTYLGNEEYLNSDLVLINKEVNEQSGHITYKFELKKTEAFSPQAEFIKVDFRADLGNSPIRINATFNDAAQYQTVLPEITMYVNNVITKDNLKVLIDAATILLNIAEEGSKPGQYSMEAISTFGNAIEKAKNVYDVEQTSQYAITYTELETAIDTFKKAVNQKQYAHYHKDYSVDTDVNYQFVDASAAIDNGKLAIHLEQGQAIAVDKDAPNLDEGMFKIKFDIDNLNDQIRFDIKNTASSRIEVGYENGRWFWGGAENGAWGNFPNQESGLLFTDKTNEVVVKFDKQENGETSVTLLVNGNEIGSIKAKFSDEKGNFRFWTRYSAKNLNVYEVIYSNAPVYTIDASCSENGSMNTLGKVEAFAETDKTFIFTPNTGYIIDKIYIDGVPLQSNVDSYTFEYLQSNHTLYVTFKLKSADTTELQNIYNEYKLVQKGDYTEESWTVFTTALKAAEALIQSDYVVEEQVVTCLEQLHVAKNQLVMKKADYSKVDQAIANVPLNLDMYTETSVQDLQKALDMVVRDKDITEQAVVDAYADAINLAINNLVKRNDTSAITKPKPVVPDQAKISTTAQVKTGDPLCTEIYIVIFSICSVVWFLLKKDKITKESRYK